MSNKKLIHRGLAAITAVFMLLSILIVGLPTTVYAEDLPTTVYAENQGITYYVDSVGGNDGNDGTSDTNAWKTITKLNDVTFMPGDNILLKAGSVWNNQYVQLNGSGTTGSAIVIDKYGEGSKPVINGNGDGVTVDGSYKAVIALYNQQYWEINNLEITNDDNFSEDDDSDVHRRAISIIAANMGVVNHIYIRNCYIHDVDANNNDKDSGGIIGRIEGDTPMTYFNDIKFENNTFEKIDRTGINFAYNTNDTYDPNAVDGYKNRYNSNVVISNNSFNDIGGDGIIAIGCNSPLIEYNALSYCRNRTTQASVAIFPWQCTNALIQYNEAYLTQATDPHGDGQAFDCDYGTDGTTYQYNYSHDNEGGFMLLCSTGDDSPPDRCYNSIVRYNISENDGMRTFRLCGPGTRFSRIYNNTIYLAADIDGEIVQNESWNGLAGETTFENNIFYILNDNEENSENVWTGNRNAKFHTSEVFNYDNNCYYGVEGPTGVYGDANKIIGDPKFVSPGGAGTGMATCEAYKLQADSSCIDTGKVIAGNGGGLDFFGNVLYNGNPDIGAHEYGAPLYNVGDPLPVPTLTEWVPNRGFETGDSTAWEFGGNSSVINSDFHGGAYCAKIGGEWSGIGRTVNDLQPNTTYTMIVWGKAESAEAPLEIGVENYGGDKKTYLVTSSIYEQVLISFTTGEANTSAFIYAYNGAGTNEPGKNCYVDDINIAKSKHEVPQQVVKELVSNRGFETGLMSPWSGYGIYSIDNSGNAHTGDYCAKVDGSSGNTGIEQVINNLLPNTAYTLTLWGKMENAEDSMVVGVADFGGALLQYDVASTSYEQLTFNFTTGASNTSAKIFVWKGSDGLGFVDEYSIVGPTSAPQDVYELAYDRSFESGSLIPWETHGVVAEFINTNAKTGNYCVRVAGDEGAGSGVRQTVNNLLPNTAYTLTGWINVENDGDDAVIGVKNYNTSVGYDQLATQAYASEGYEQVTINFTTGPNDTSALIFGYKWTLGNAYFDDFSLIGPTTATEVSGVSVTGAGGSNTITAKNGTLQMQAAVLPADATNKAVIWSVVNGTGSATIDASGLLTAIADGTVTIKASAQDGSNIEGTAEVTISGQTVAEGGNTPSTPASTPAPTPTPTPAASGTLKVEAKLDANGLAKVDLKASDIAAAIQTTKDNIVIIEVKPVVGAKEVEINIPAQQLSAAEEKHVESIKFDTGLAIVTIPLSVFKDSISGTSSNVRLSVTQSDSTLLTEKVRQVVGGNKVYDFNLSVDGNKISKFNSTGKDTYVEIAVNYTLKEGEDPGKVVVYYINDSGKLEVVKNGRYEPTTGKVEFKVKHFSKYTAVYTAANFKDAKKIPWAKEGIETLAARGIIDTATLEAEKNVTRAEFIYMLMNTLDLVEETAKSTFKDVKEGSKYYTAISTAKKLGISAGYNGSFGVDDEISRQDMAVMIYKAGLIVKAKLNSNVKSLDVADKLDISSYATESVAAIRNAGIMNGIGKNKFAPKAKASTAQAVVVIYNLFKLT